MIEGYSVDEAASVLGVPEGRVWELLARGILAGTPEIGGGMRVYLQGRPTEPIVGTSAQGRPADPVGRPAGGNGNGGEHGQPGFEASPFRELLTEFRNLTERYGQALLALGEARGEVAGLRMRVEVLEARVDLRLPSAAPLVQWSPPQPQAAVQEEEPEQEPMAESVAGGLGLAEPDGLEPSDGAVQATGSDEEALEAVVAEQPEPPAAAVDVVEEAPKIPVAKTSRSRRRQRKGARSATKGFAEALARAQDPTASQLPGGDEAQAAFNELRERIRRESVVDEGREAAEVAAAEPEPADTVGLAEFAAPAEEVELDSLLADEGLGGAIPDATAPEVIPFAQADLAEPAELIEWTELPAMAEPAESTEPIYEGEATEDVPAAEVEQLDAVEVLEAPPAREPEEAAEAEQLEAVKPVPPVEVVQAAEVEQPVAVESVPPVEVVQAAEAEQLEAVEPVPPVEVVQAAEVEQPVAVESVQPVEVVQAAEAEQLEAVEPVEVASTPEPDDVAVPPAEEAATAATPAYNPEWDEPDWIAEEDVDWGSSEPAAPQEPVAMGESPEIGWAELPAATIEAPIEAPIEAAEPDDLEADRQTNDSSDLSADVGTVRSPVTEASPPQAIQVETLGPTSRPDDAAPQARDLQDEQPPSNRAMQAQQHEEELMWLGDEFRAGPAAWSAPGRATTIPRPSAQEVTVSPAEDEALARLAVERGWDDEELHAIRSLLAQPGRAVLAEPAIEEARSAAGKPAPTDSAPGKVDPTSVEARDLGTQAEETRDADSQSDQTTRADAPEEEAFDWEQGPSAWSPARRTRQPRELPGAVEVDQAMAAFEVGAWSKQTVDRHADQPTAVEPGDRDPFSQLDEPPAKRPVDLPRSGPSATSAPPHASAPRTESGPPTRSPAPPPASSGGRPESPSVPSDASREADADWLRGRRGPAASAYRRLRRLFP